MTIKVNYSIGDIFISVEGECPEEVLKVVEGLTGEKKIPQEDEEESLWDLAPEWANWVAKDSTGEIYWYECEPYMGSFTWFDHRGRTILAFSTECGVPCALLSCSPWFESKQERP